MHGQQINTPTQTVMRALDLDDDDMVKQPIEQRRCDHSAAEDAVLFCKAAVRGGVHCSLFVAVSRAVCRACSAT